MADKVAKALNQLCNEEFTAALSARDRESLSNFVAEYFDSADANCSDDEEELEEELGGDGM